MAMYESEITKFIRELKAKNPALDQEQRIGRQIWWDKTPVSPDDQERLRASRVEQQPYVYQTKG